MNSAPATDNYGPHGMRKIPNFSEEIFEPKTVLQPNPDGLIGEIEHNSFARTIYSDERESFSALTPKIPIDIAQ
jgi:hypothetical protein